MRQNGFSSILLILLIFVFLGIITLLFLQNIKDSKHLTFLDRDQKLTELNKPAAHNASNTLANPASVNCGKVGGESVIQTMPNGGQVGICDFEDNQSCEEWALFYGNCPVGGVKTIGFDTPAQVYCAQLGGQTLAVKNATCTLPSGKVCNDEDLYNGDCDIN